MRRARGLERGRVYRPHRNDAATRLTARRGSRRPTVRRVTPVTGRRRACETDRTGPPSVWVWVVRSLRGSYRGPLIGVLCHRTEQVSAIRDSRYFPPSSLKASPTLFLRRTASGAA